MLTKISIWIVLFLSLSVQVSADSTPQEESLGQNVTCARPADSFGFLLNPGPSASGQCDLNGSECDFSSDCCSGWCSSGKCKGSGSCTGNGGSCTFSSDCCSGWCSSGECRGSGSCTVKGAACDFSSDCCSDWCSSGKCK